MICFLPVDLAAFVIGGFPLLEVMPVEEAVKQRLLGIPVITVDGLGTS